MKELIIDWLNQYHDATGIPGVLVWHVFFTGAPLWFLLKAVRIC
jgi:hypothetical protein